MKSQEEIRAALTGPVASVRTPFTRDGAIDFAGLRRVIDVAIDGGSKTVLLTNGDSLYSILTDEEVAEVTRVTAEHVGERALVVAADRVWATPAEVAFARFARGVGAHVLMVLCPDWAGSCTMDTLVEHFAAVAAEIPVMLVTNWLEPRSQAFGVGFIEQLRDQVPGVVAIKDDLCGAFARKMGLAAHGSMAIISGGQKQNHLNAMPYGCDGYLSTYVTFCPRIAHAYWDAVSANDLVAAAGVIRDYDIPLFDSIGALPGGFDAGMHGIQELFGIAQRWRRKPYYSLNDAEMEQLAGFFRDKGLL
ncbi:MAG: dihydrodipicolinate synthase family protein [Candidatus Hydrogenedentes bacterium]|nr:dihydrodipicolinate synthase family protein [Candidatus Hydrogenedentota bacterium]